MNMVQNLKTLREKHNVSQQRLAAAVGVSQQSINKYENHNIEPEIRTLIRIADFFHVSVDYLIGHGDDSEEKTPCQLNDDELKLVYDYRNLSLSQRESIRLVMENYCK